MAQTLTGEGRHHMCSAEINRNIRTPIEAAGINSGDLFPWPTMMKCPLTLALDRRCNQGLR